VLANRLSADPTVSVALLEAGPSDNTPLVSVPSFVGTLMFHKRYSWGYQTLPQPQLGGREILLPRGRILGGCSSTNGMVYFRGHPRDFDGWASMGNAGWSFREVLPYFLRSENNDDYRHSPWHGTEGEMHISHVRQYSPLITPLLAATTALGYGRCEDFNGVQDPVGFDVRQNAIHQGKRVSGASAFLAPIRHRKNLHVFTNCFVKRIAIADGRATGVEIERAGSTETVYAKREVLLSAGAYGSPAILQHSGIGDATWLHRLGIEVKLHRPSVGHNLHDHPSAVVQMKTNNTESYGLSWSALPRNALSVFQYLFARRGQLAGNLFEVTGFLRTLPGLQQPDLQFVFMPANRPTPGTAFPRGHGFGINSILLQPKSRGSVRINSKHPQQAPLIDNAFLRDEADVDALLRGLRIARKILAMPQLAHYQASELLPGPALNQDDELRDYLKRACSAVHHPGGSCRMGNDSNAVVDPQLKLRGLNGLRVIDASIFPRMVSGNSNAGVVMVAEKAADMIQGKPALPPMDLS
jgi:choline dehydrogenase